MGRRLALADLVACARALRRFVGRPVRFGGGRRGRPRRPLLLAAAALMVLALPSPAAAGGSTLSAEGAVRSVVSAGGDHTCAIKTDGSLECWGFDGAGQVSGPNAEGGTFTQVSAAAFAYVRDQDRRQPRMLGLRRLRAGVGAQRGGRHVHPGQRRPATIRARSRPTASLECWGFDGSGQVSGPNAEGGTFTQVSAGGEHTCAIKTDGTLECWGFDGSGQVSGPNAEGGTFTQVSAGDGTIRARSRPTAAWNAGAPTAPGRCRARTRRAARSPSSAPAATIRARSRPTAASNAGASTAPGRCRARTRRAARSPSSAPAASIRARSRPTAASSAGASTAPGRCRARTRRAARSARRPSRPALAHTCAIKTAGGLECWGNDGCGQVSGPNAEGGTFTQVSAGGEHTCAIKTAGTLECWGFDGSGQVSGPNAEGGTFTQVSAGGFHTCAIKTAGSLECWGDDGAGQVSGPNAEGGTFTQVSAANLTIRARSRPPATLECWGNDGSGQVSGPNAEGGTFTQVSAGLDHTCAIKTAGGLECWGFDSSGQVSGPNAEGGTFTQVSAGACTRARSRPPGPGMLGQRRLRAGVGPEREGGTFTQLSAGIFHTCAIKTAGTLECWGSTAPGSLVPRRRRARLPLARPARAHSSTRSRRARDAERRVHGQRGDAAAGAGAQRGRRAVGYADRGGLVHVHGHRRRT